MCWNYFFKNINYLVNMFFFQNKWRRQCNRISCNPCQQIMSMERIGKNIISTSANLFIPWFHFNTCHETNTANIDDRPQVF